MLFMSVKVSSWIPAKSSESQLSHVILWNSSFLSFPSYQRLMLAAIMEEFETIGFLEPKKRESKPTHL